MSDPYWNQVSALLHCDGINGSTRIIDEKNHAFPCSGNASISTLQSKFGGSSLYFDGSDDYILSPSHADFKIGTSDFTLEAFLFPRDTANTKPTPFIFDGVGTTSQSWFSVDHSAAAGKFAFFVGNVSTTTPHLVSTSNVVYDQWTHVAVTRSGTTWRLFVNGVLESTASSSVWVTSISNTTGQFFLGGNSIAENQYFGYIDEFRLTVGVARYAADFTVPTAPYAGGPVQTDPNFDKVTFLANLAGENNGVLFSDKKGHPINRVGNPVTVTSVSKFNGSSMNTNGYIEVSATDDFNLGAGDFTIEGWLRSNVEYDNAPNYYFLKLLPEGFVTAHVAFGCFGSGVHTQLRLPAVSGDTTVTTGFSTGMAANWAFMSLSRSGSALYLHTNGVFLSTNILGVDCSMPNAAYRLQLGGLGFSGNLSDFRITKGFARYGSSNYSPPTTPHPDKYVKKMTGTVRDSSGNPISRTVRAYRSSDGLLTDSGVSDSTTGSFSLAATDDSEHFVVVHDPSKNALVYDHIIPVIV